MVTRSFVRPCARLVVVLKERSRSSVLAICLYFACVTPRPRDAYMLVLLLAVFIFIMLFNFVTATIK